MTSPGCPSQNIATNFGVGFLTDWPDLNLILLFHPYSPCPCRDTTQLFKCFNYIGLTFLLKAVIGYQVNV